MGKVAKDGALLNDWLCKNNKAIWLLEAADELTVGVEVLITEPSGPSELSGLSQAMKPRKPSEPILTSGH